MNIEKLKNIEAMMLEIGKRGPCAADIAATLAIVRELIAENTSAPMPTERREFLRDVMCDVYESGIGYWARVRNVKRDDARGYLSFDVQGDDEDEDDETKWHTITPEAMHEAICKLKDGRVKVRKAIVAQFAGYPHNLDACDYDAEGADVCVQIACFGEIVYG